MIKIKIKDVKNYIGKKVYYKPPYCDKTKKFLLVACIWRIKLPDLNKFMYQLELMDTNSNCNNNSVLIAPIDDVYTELEE